MKRGKATLSLEPGGQFELSGSPFSTARAAHDENLQHLAELGGGRATLGLRWWRWGTGRSDSGGHAVDAEDALPGDAETLRERGQLALNMMLMTVHGAGVARLGGRGGLRRKRCWWRGWRRLLVGLYANSPLSRASRRVHVVSQSRLGRGRCARCGFLPAMFDGSFSYRAYVEWALDAPLLFLRRRGEYLHPKLTSASCSGGLRGPAGGLDDWTDHLSTLFPEVRIKRVLESRRGLRDRRR